MIEKHGCFSRRRLANSTVDLRCPTTGMGKNTSLGSSMSILSPLPSPAFFSIDNLIRICGWWELGVYLSGELRRWRYITFTNKRGYWQ